MVHATVLEFSYPTPEIASTVIDSISVEAGAIPGDRTTATVEQDGDVVRIEVEADDLSALRAGVHTWCSLLETVETTVETLG